MAASKFIRLPRLQFSLRVLLLFMLLVSVGLLVYRWPWEVVDEKAGIRNTTSYRRNWQSKPVKHGLETVAEWDDKIGERWYEDGDLRVERKWLKPISTKVNPRYLNGEKNAPIWVRDGDFGEHVRIEYRNGKQHGELTTETPNRIVREQWREGSQHGRTTWETKTGRLLQSAEYEQGRLKKWNDLPVAEALEEWVTKNVTDAELRRGLLTPFSSLAGKLAMEFMHYGVLRLKPLDKSQESLDFFVNYDGISENAFGLKKGNSWGEMLLDDALKRGGTFAIRYNMLFVVSIDAESLEWQDRTGVSEVRFEPGSEQEKFWLQPAKVEGLAPAARFHAMFAASGEAPIVLDTSEIKDAEIPPFDGVIAKHDAYGVRRDLFGEHLNSERCYVVQEGNKLIIRGDADRR